MPLFDAAGACDANMEHRAYDLEHQRDILQEKVLALQVRSRDDAKAAETAVARVRRVLKIAEAEKESEFLKRVEAEGALGCVEINQCVGCTRQSFTTSFLGDDAAVLAPSSGEGPASPRHRACVASMAWRSTRRFRTNATLSLIHI